MSEPALKVERLSKAFRVPREPAGAGRAPADPRRRPAGRRDLLQVLDDVGFEVPRGGALAVVGANGSGKTTLLKILAGVMQPDSGRAEARGRVGALLELGAGFHPELTGIENVHLSGAALGLGRRATERYLPEIIAMAELERFMDLPVKHYSSGMLVRLGFAVASRLDPEIVLLDETFAVGDARFQARAIGKIKEMRAAGATLVLVSHNLDLLDALADRALWLEAGKARAEGEARATLDAYRRAAREKAETGEAAPGRTPAGTADGARIVGARARGIDGAGGAEAGVIELESADGLALEIELEIAAGAAGARLSAECLFTRDDGATLARACAPLPEIAPGPARRERMELAIAPIMLARGDWRMRARLRGDGESAAPGPAFDLAETVRIRTPLPYDFRLAAALPAAWE